MTRPPAIRMDPARLPDLTPDQKERAKAFRKHFKGIGKVSITRKGQKHGHICITVTERDKMRRYWYDTAGELQKATIQRQLFEITAELAEPESAILLNTNGDSP